MTYVAAMSVIMTFFGLIVGLTLYKIRFKYLQYAFSLFLIFELLLYLDQIFYFLRHIQLLNFSEMMPTYSFVAFILILLFTKTIFIYNVTGKNNWIFIIPLSFFMIYYQALNILLSSNQKWDEIIIDNEQTILKLFISLVMTGILGGFIILNRSKSGYSSIMRGKKTGRT